MFISWNFATLNLNTMKDYEVMLMALSKEREELHDKLMQVDRIIKKVKSGEYMGYSNAITLDITPKPQQSQRIAFPKHTDAKVIVLKAMDNLSQLASLKQIQAEYSNITGNEFNIRDTVRGLNKSKLLLLMREKNAERGNYWVKSEWLVDGRLLDEYKPDGFDLLYNPDNLEFK